LSIAFHPKACRAFFCNLCEKASFYGIVQENGQRVSQEETRMKCVICQYGETEPGTTTVTLTRDETTIVIRDVPAQICTTCGEEYVDAATGKRLSQIAETAVNEGVQVDVRRYKAA
jgi:YgiT-type zinc finger domain-containing protein